MDPFYASVNSGARPSPRISYTVSRMCRLADVARKNVFILSWIDWCHLVRGEKEYSCFPWPSLARFQRGLGRGITYFR